MMRLSAALLVCVLPAAAQEPGAVSVIDAVALDSAGHPVAGLTAADFEVTAAGKTLPVLRLSYFDTIRHTAVTPTTLPALELTPAQIHRTTVFIIDDLCLSADGLEETRTRLRHFVEDLLAPGDQAAILRSSGGSNQARPLTADRARLTAMINDTQYLGGSVAPTACAASAWTAVAYAATGLAPLSGRKTVVLMSGDLRSPTGNAAEAIARLAAESMTAVYTSSGAPSDFAGATGGGAGLDLDRVAAESGSYYALAFPAAGRNVQLKVRRPGVTLRVRGEAAGLAPVIDFPAPVSPGEPMAEVMSSPFDGAGIGVQVTPIFDNSAAEGAVVDVLCHVQLSDLGYLRDAAGRYHLAFQIGADSVIEGGRVLRLFVRDQELHLSADEYRRAATEGITANLRLKWGSGPRDVRVVVADQRSGRMGSASAFVQVQDVASGALFLSGIGLRGEDTSKDNPAVRVFHAGETLAFKYNIFNASMDKENGSRVQARARLVAGGREIFTGDPSTIVFVASRDPRRRQVVGHLTLGKSVGPGRYILQVMVTDLLAPERRTTGQFIDFTVEP